MFRLSRPTRPCLLLVAGVVGAACRAPNPDYGGARAAGDAASSDANTREIGSDGGPGGRGGGGGNLGNGADGGTGGAGGRGGSGGAGGDSTPADALGAPDALGLADAGAGGMGGGVGDANPDGPGDGSSSRRVRYTFDQATEGWADVGYRRTGAQPCVVSRVTTPVFAGAGALELAVRTTATHKLVTFGRSGDGLGPGDLIHYQVFVPRGVAVVAINPYVTFFARDTVQTTTRSTSLAATTFARDAWNLISLPVPTEVDGARGVVELGIEVQTDGARSFSVYVDSISW